MTKSRSIFIGTVTYFLVFLFFYTAYYKIADHTNFTAVLTKSPSVPGQLAPLIAWAIPIMEIIAAIMLIIPKRKKTGLYLSLTLLAVFTAYLIYMVVYKMLTGNLLPCNCGGVISALTWQEHIVFNLVLLALTIAAIYLGRDAERNTEPPLDQNELLLN